MRLQMKPPISSTVHGVIDSPSAAAFAAAAGGLTACFGPRRRDVRRRVGVVRG